MELKKVIKALLFSDSESVGVRDIQDVFRRYRQRAQEVFEKADDEERVYLEEGLKVPELVTQAQIREAVEFINRELEEGEDVYQVIEEVEGYRLVLRAEYASWVRLYRKEEKPQRLSGAVMETLALVAYRQPITRAEMELIRGVSVDNAVNKLLEHELIGVEGHANLPGKPRLYVTTEKFLSFCGMQSLGDLPASDVLSAEKINEWVAEAGARSRYSEKELGLAVP